MNAQINSLTASILGGWTAELNVRSVVLRILLSVVLAAVIGCEREALRSLEYISHIEEIN